MEEIRFLVDSSVGELEVQLFDDGWTTIDPTSPTPDSTSVEDIIRNEQDLAQAFEAMGVPADEAVELAEELWSELSHEEKKERAWLRALDEKRSEWKSRTRGPR